LLTSMFRLLLRESEGRQWCRWMERFDERKNRYR
jgi:hypothetical protein